MKRRIYPDKLETEIINNLYIPRKMKPNEYLKQYHKYYMPYYDSTVKVLDIWNIDGIDYYHLRSDMKLDICTSHPVDDNGYELLHNYDNIQDKDIINDGNSYTGAEIKFWFTVKKINLNEGSYSHIWRYLNPSSKYFLVDNKFYKIIKESHGKKFKLQIIVDKTR